MQLGILRSDCWQQESPPLLANAVMVVWPVGWSRLHTINSFLNHTPKHSKGLCPACPAKLHAVMGCSTLSWAVANRPELSSYSPLEALAPGCLADTQGLSSTQIHILNNTKLSRQIKGHQRGVVTGRHSALREVVPNSLTKFL